ncbi:MAG TPA: FAD-binding oxidoreductase, partial [Ktedonobacteraceae bacterium]|nr:FAD-binding oxidoreductase [Ktedonobacteraceae bacterium]
SHRINTRAPRGNVPDPIKIITDRDQLEAVEHDAANYPGGKAFALVKPQSEAEIAAILQRYAKILAVGAQSSVTGGASPNGEVVLSLARQDSILESRSEYIRAQAGLSLRTLRETLALEDKYYPPVPSYDGATVGGVISTNAAGPATFKYGATRPWVQAVTVILVSGAVLELERGQCIAHPDGYFEIDEGTRLYQVPVPTYKMPQVPKCSAGYYAKPGMDLIDLFIGSEGTLGVITEATLRVVSPRPEICVALVPCVNEAQAIALTRSLRENSLKTRQTDDPRGLDVSAIEYMDDRSVQILREDGSDRRNAISLGPDARTLLLIQFELHPTWAARAYDDLAQALEPDAPDVPLVQLVRILEQSGRLEGTELVMPGDWERIERMYALREAVPYGVNARVLHAKQNQHPSITKMAADMIVPFDHLGTMMQIFRKGFEAFGLDYAIWGHISDGNMHPNILPRSLVDIQQAQQVLLKAGKEVMSLGGCPLAEHGVGRNPIKKALLKGLYGKRGLRQMFAVKQALDPEGKLAQGNLF